MDKELQTARQVQSQQPQDQAELRRRRIQEYSEESLANPDALSANLGAEVGNLMSMGHRLQKAIEETMMGTQDTLKELNKVKPAMEMYLKITKQWDRLIQLNQRLSKMSTNRTGEERG